MDVPAISLHPEGDAGLWVFRFVVPNMGQISRGEVKIQTSLADEDVPAGTQKEMAVEKIRLLAEALLRATDPN